MNSTKFAELFTADAHFSIWNFPTSIGHEQIKNGCQGMFSMVTSLEHKSSRLMSVDEGMLVQLMLSYDINNQ